MPGLSFEAEKAILEEHIRRINEDQDRIIQIMQALRDEGMINSEEGQAIVRQFRCNNANRKGYRRQLLRMTYLQEEPRWRYL